MKRINLRTGFVIIAIYEILYWLIFNISGKWLYSDEDWFQMILWTVAVPVAAIVIYFLIRWVSKKNKESIRQLVRKKCTKNVLLPYS